MNEKHTKYQPVLKIISGQLLDVSNKNDSYPSIPLRALKRTKIIATLGPSCNDTKTLKAMILGGMNVARLNMSHGDHDSHEKNLQKIRNLSKQMDHPVAVLADLQGPKIRVGKLKDDIPVEWRAGENTVITVAKCEDGTAARVGTSYKGLAGDVKPGDRILVDDGRLRLQVEKVEGEDVHCLIVVGGTLRSKKGINLPGVEVSAGALSSKDKSDLSWAIENDVDYIALSFVRTARDVKNMRARIAETGRNIPIIAKIERVEAVNQIDEILEVSDGIMVARGDLGIELSIEQLPIIQKELILQASKMGKLVITATQMLESMIENPIPTRAEATDVANAVFDGTDAVMLSGETAMGRHPIEAVKEMSGIILAAERSRYLTSESMIANSLSFKKLSRTLTAASQNIAEELDSKGIVVFSNNTEKALLLSKYRTRKLTFAVCHDEKTWRTYCLYWGIVAVLIPPGNDYQDLLEGAVESLLKHDLINESDVIVVLMGFSSEGVDSIKLHTV